MVAGLLGNESSDSNRFTLITPKSENDVRLQATLGNQNPTGFPVGVVSLVNDHTFFKKYDMWETKAIVFCFENFEICFEKQDCWFPMEIEIHKGHDLLNMIDDGKDILNDFDRNPFAAIERTIVEIVGNLK